MALRQRLSWFATTFRGHVCEMLSVVMKQLNTDLEATADVDGMVAAFDTFQSNLISKLLLHENLAPIRGSLLAMFDLYEDLALEWRDAVKQVSNHTSRPTPRQLVIQQNYSARRSRPEIDDTADLSEGEEEANSGQYDQRSVLSVPSLSKEYNRQLSFLLAGIRSVSRIEGEPAWIMLSERLQWGITATERR